MWTREEAVARRAEQAQQALANAVEGTSEMNYEAIYEGFEAKGIDPEDVLPRENVFTFNAWLALGRAVRKGEHGVKVTTFIPRTKKDEQTGEETTYRIPKTTTVFHISQTEPVTPRH
jgi:antirestriction protein ArdC